MAQIRLHGYTDPLSLKAGQRIQAYVSLEGAQEVKAQLVRLIHGDEHPEGPGFVEELQESSINRAWPAQRQYVQQGAWLNVDDPQGRLALAAGALTLHAFVFPTLPGAGRQVILGRWDLTAQRGLALGINPSGHLELAGQTRRRVSGQHRRAQRPVAPPGPATAKTGGHRLCQRRHGPVRALQAHGRLLAQKRVLDF